MKNVVKALWVLFAWRIKYGRWYTKAAASVWRGVDICNAVVYGYSRCPIELDISPIAAKYVESVPRSMTAGQTFVAIEGCPKCGFDAKVEVGLSVKCLNQNCDYVYEI